MANIPDDVKPGDLITASMWTAVLAVLRDHETRLETLEQAVVTTGAVVITQVVPAGPVHVGDQLQLIGRNFGIPGLNAVNINGVPVTGFMSGSSDTLLIFNIPSMQVPAAGQTATLNLSNSNGFASTTIFLLPGAPALPSGQIFVAMSQPPSQPTVTAGQDLIFGFAVTGVTSLDETYTVTASVDAGWPAVLVNNSTPPQPITPSQIFIPQGNPSQPVNTTFQVRVSVPAGIANGVTGQFHIALASQRNPTGLNATSQNLAVTVGSPPPGAQNNVVISLNQVSAPASLAAGVVSMPTTGAQARIDFSAMIKTPGTYTVATSFANPADAGHWAASVIGNTGFTTTSANANQLVSLALSAAAGSQATSLTLKISSGGATPVSGQLVQPLSVRAA